MTGETSGHGVLTEWYRSRIGSPSTDDEVMGYWIFVLGLLLGILGILLLITSEAGSAIRGWSIIIAALGLALLIAGPIIRLPLPEYTSLMVFVGVVLSLVGIIWFSIAYPDNWRPQASPIITTYALGLLLMAGGGVFAPLLSSRHEQAASRLREELTDTIADETDLAAVIEDLRMALRDTTADEADLARALDDLRTELREVEADETDLAARLRALRTSQARFELYEDAGDEFRWRLRHRNGNITATSGEGYTRKHNAQRAIAGVRRDALGATITLIESEAELPAAAESFEPFEDVKSRATFETYEDNAGEFRWRLKHANGHILCDSAEGYASRGNLSRALERMREYVGPAQYLRFDPTAIEIYRDAGGEYRWRLVHKNGNILADSGEGYSRYNDARRAVERIQADLEDLRDDIYEDAAGEYRWRLEAPNGRIVADSGEGYRDRRGAADAVDRFGEYAPVADVLEVTPAAFELYEDKGGEWRWRLRHRNGNILADSGEGYASRSAARDGIESVKRNAPNAPTEEH